MSFAGAMIGLLIFWYGASPKSFGKHLSECVNAYRAALRSEGGE